MKRLIQKTAATISVHARNTKVRITYWTQKDFFIIGYGRNQDEAVEQCQACLMDGDKALVTTRNIEFCVKTGLGPNYGVRKFRGRTVFITPT